MGAAASLSTAKPPAEAIREGRAHAQFACSQLRRSLLEGRVPGHVTVVVDLGFAKQTLAFNVSGSDIKAAAKAKEARLAAKDADSEAAADPASPVVFPPASVASMVKDVKRLTAAVSAHNLDAALQSATATRCFMAGKTLFLVTVSIDPHALASAS